MSTLLFLDTETTGLSLDDDIWEFAAIRRRPDGSESEHHMFIEHDKEKCRRLPETFKADHKQRFPAPQQGFPPVASRRVAAGVIAALMADRPHIVGAVPNFDTERLALLLRRYGYEPGWHYHLIDIEALAVGYLHGIARDYGQTAAAEFLTTGLPWDSDDLSRAVGVEPPGEGERHTAVGDARWAMRVYDAITGGAS